jgi:hypothetical protein
MTEQRPEQGSADAGTAPQPAPMPQGEAFIENYFSQALVSQETKSRDGGTEQR